MPGNLPATIATAKATQAQIQALVTGAIPIAGCDATFVVQPDQGALLCAFEPPLADVAELSLSSHIARKSRGDCPYVALPVYLRRAFLHGSLYIRTDRGISTARDLGGRTIGITNYEHTAYAWARALLSQEYGIEPPQVQWISAPREASSHLDPSDFTPPRDVSIRPAEKGKTLAGMLEAGEIDAVVSPSPLSCHGRGASGVARLFPDSRAAEDDYFRRSSIYPILHILGMRVDLAKQHPSLAEEISRAFNRALSPARPTTVADDRRALELFLGHHHAQGLSHRRVTIEEFFS